MAEVPICRPNVCHVSEGAAGGVLPIEVLKQKDGPLVRQSAIWFRLGGSIRKKVVNTLRVSKKSRYSLPDNSVTSYDEDERQVQAESIALA